eukprot:COSAG01_NODE_43822_length_425_cov_15.524540_2_plen_29_part_01
MKEHAEAEQAVEVCGAGRETVPPAQATDR